ncbi:hypothetical protein DTW68_10165 [Vibrio harveyi]|uniref:Uncharacterized protein n=1 Tax=Vibrio harveyi TaxID=669 RepID=A0A8B3DGM0_VIBHA|nr:hypothetical protein AL469_010995 [Vibrio harveyi]RCR63451.1 hypothetical protein DTW68_10165 [Vibrio harveyi]RIW10732.1 hypothetical protein DS957_016775 [Vibrio harveyi]
MFVVKLETGTVQASADTIILLYIQQPKLYLNHQKASNSSSRRVSVLWCRQNFVRIALILTYLAFCQYVFICLGLNPLSKLIHSLTTSVIHKMNAK